ncbi:unnamed protein product [Pedinophyceae sp. YPF-701]|nr:unnamed protein product [Pedinophyceae sp. YPF-701]
MSRPGTAETGGSQKRWGEDAERARDVERENAAGMIYPETPPSTAPKPGSRGGEDVQQGVEEGALGLTPGVSERDVSFAPDVEEPVHTTLPHQPFPIQKQESVPPSRHTSDLASPRGANIARATTAGGPQTQEVAEEVIRAFQELNAVHRESAVTEGSPPIDSQVSFKADGGADAASQESDASRDERIRAAVARDQAAVMRKTMERMEQQMLQAGLRGKQSHQSLGDALGRWEEVQKDVIERWNGDNDFAKVDIMLGALLRQGAFGDAYRYLRKVASVVAAILKKLHRKGVETGALDPSEPEPVGILGSMGGGGATAGATGRGATSGAMTSQAHTHRRQAEANSQKIQEMKNQLELLELSMEKLRQENAALKILNHSDRQTVKEKEAEMSTLLSRLTTKGAELQTEAMRSEHIKRTLAAANDQVRKLVEALKQSQAETRLANQHASQLRSKVLVAREETRMKGGDEDMLRVMLTDSEDKILELKKVVASRNAALAAGKRAHDEAKAKLQDRISALEAQLAERDALLAKSGVAVPGARGEAGAGDGDGAADEGGEEAEEEKGKEGKAGVLFPAPPGRKKRMKQVAGVYAAGPVGRRKDGSPKKGRGRPAPAASESQKQVGEVEA